MAPKENQAHRTIGPSIDTRFFFIAALPAGPVVHLVAFEQADVVGINVIPQT
jgi:hypothetical protein